MKNILHQQPRGFSRTICAFDTRLVPVEPTVKGSETCELLNNHGRDFTRSAKSTDPTCYNASRSMKTGLFEIVETNMKAKHKLRVGDLVRVKQAGGSLGPTLYVVDYLGSDHYESGPNIFRCVIREAGNPLSGGQEFDTTILQRVDRDTGRAIAA